MKQLTLLLAIYWFSLYPAFAEDIEYDFELIVFEDTSDRYKNAEQWEHELPVSTTAETQSDNRAENARMNIKQIRGIGLDKYARKLNANKRYNVLVHKAWRQKGLTNDTAVDITIDSRKSSTTTSAAAPDTGTGSSRYNSENIIFGSIKIVLGRYLHIYTNMIYQQPHANVQPGQYDQAMQPYKYYPIKSHRRMRSKELHYLDHPMVGILVMAMPVEKEDT